MLFNPEKDRSDQLRDVSIKKKEVSAVDHRINTVQFF